MGSVSNSNVARIESRPATSSLPSALKFYVEGSSRLQLQETTSTLTTNLDVTGDLTAANILTSSGIAATYQPILESTQQDNHTHGIFSALATGAQTGKLRYLTASAGCQALASFEGISITNAP